MAWKVAEEMQKSENELNSLMMKVIAKLQNGITLMSNSALYFYLQGISALFLKLTEVSAY